MTHQRHDYVERHDSYEILTVRDMNSLLKGHYCVYQMTHEKHTIVTLKQ